MIHSISAFRRSLYLCILGALGLVLCTSCKSHQSEPKGDPRLQEAEWKGPDREAEIELKLELVFNDLTSTTAQASPSADCFDIELKNNGSKTIQLAKLKLGYTADLVLTYHRGHKTGDACKDQFIIVQADSRNDVHDMTLEALTGQVELAAGALVAVKTSVETGEAVNAAKTQLKVVEANETRVSQDFNFTKPTAKSNSEATEESYSEREGEAEHNNNLDKLPTAQSELSSRLSGESSASTYYNNLTSELSSDPREEHSSYLGKATVTPDPSGDRSNNSQGGVRDSFFSKENLTKLFEAVKNKCKGVKQEGEAQRNNNLTTQPTAESKPKATEESCSKREEPTVSEPSSDPSNNSQGDAKAPSFLERLRDKHKDIQQVGGYRKVLTSKLEGVKNKYKGVKQEGSYKKALIRLKEFLDKKSEKR